MKKVQKKGSECAKIYDLNEKIFIFNINFIIK